MKNLVIDNAFLPHRKDLSDQKIDYDSYDEEIDDMDVKIKIYLLF